jgi:anti-sigma factor RsiW
MSEHLTSEQFSKWIIGQCSPAEEEHGRTCPACSSELAEFQTALTGFRRSIEKWADQKAVAIPDATRLHSLSRPSTRRPLLWIPVAAAAAALAIIPAYKNSMERQREAQAEQETQVDAKLLERVNAHLSRTAPASLEPLVELLAGSQNAKTENQGEHR